MRIHEGRNVKRFREMLGIKQEALAAELGTDWNQKKISLLEQRERIDAPILDQVSKALKIPVEAIQKFDEEKVVNIISNTASFDNCEQPAFFNFYPTFNPLDKLVEAYEEIRRLNEALLREKDERIKILETKR
ncbi:helix-turn-helix domain-containing protein [Siphonobacter aquaeclarae]|nr:helix-turn-helix transcriptional regulator [Siphonobacter aquaeclarae]